MTIRRAYDSRLLDQDGPVDPRQIREHINERELLAPHIERNKYHVNRMLENAPLEAAAGRLYQIFEGAQQDIHQWIAHMAQTPRIAPPEDLCWTEENIRLLAFYSYLRDDPRTIFAYEICEGFRVAAKLTIQKKSASSSFQIRKALEREAILRVRAFIGKVVFAADRVPDKFKKEMKFEGIEKADHVEWIVKEQLNTVSKLLRQRNRTDEYALEGGDIMYSIELAGKIAEILLTARGQLNVGMIETIKDHFFREEFTLSESQQGIVFVLDRINASWQKGIDAVEPPVSPEIASSAMIRADLGMLPGEEITKWQCQREVLGALLSQMCHRHAGNSLAIAWLTKNDDFLLHCLADYTALVRDGCLTRVVGGNPESFFFKNTISNAMLSKTITLSSRGAVAEFDETPFWKIPSLIAACRQMGITDLEDHSSDRKVVLLQQLFGSEKPPKNLTWDELIYECAKNEAGLTRDPGELLSAGRYGFSVASNRLLNAWETSLAALSEVRPGDYVRDNVNGCALKALRHIFANRENTASHHQKTLIKEVEAVFQKIFNGSYRLVYNAAIPHFSPEGNYFSGGYELYQKVAGDLTHRGVRIATPEEFRALVLGALDQTKAAEDSRVTCKEDRRVIDSIIQALRLCACGTNFMRNVLYLYDVANREDRDPVAHYQTLHRTPMTSLDGNNPWEVMAVDTGMDFTPDIRTIRPNDPEDLLKWLLGLAKWKEATAHVSDDGVPGFIIDGREFKHFLSSDLSADMWIKKTLIDPGLQISRAEMDDGSKLIFCQKVQEWLSDQNGGAIPESSARELEALFSILHSRVISVQQFAQRCHDGLFPIFNLRPQQASALDAMLLQSLPAAQSRAIQQGAVPFALREDIFICCFFNPRTEKVDYGSIAGNKTGLKPMDSFEWLGRLSTN